MEIGVSAVSLADICIRYGTLLVKTCKSYRHAEPEIAELILLVETRWIKIKIQRQLELVRNIWPSLDDEYQIHQSSVLHVLHGKAQAAISLIDSIIGKAGSEPSASSIVSKKGQVRRLKYAVWVKHSLGSVLDDLKEWSEVFDVSWYLIIRLSSKEIDRELEPVHTGEAEPLSTLKDLRVAIHHHIDTRDSKKTPVFVPAVFFDEGSDEIKTPLFHSTAEVWRSKADEIGYVVEQPAVSLPYQTYATSPRFSRKSALWSLEFYLVEAFSNQHPGTALYSPYHQTTAIQRIYAHSSSPTSLKKSFSSRFLALVNSVDDNANRACSLITCNSYKDSLELVEFLL